MSSKTLACLVQFLLHNLDQGQLWEEPDLCLLPRHFWEAIMCRRCTGSICFCLDKLGTQSSSSHPNTFSTCAWTPENGLWQKRDHSSMKHWTAWFGAQKPRHMLPISGRLWAKQVMKRLVKKERWMRSEEGSADGEKRAGDSEHGGGHSENRTIQHLCSQAWFAQTVRSSILLWTAGTACMLKCLCF